MNGEARAVCFHYFVVMKKWMALFFLISGPLCLKGQFSYIDSMKLSLLETVDDSSRYKTLYRLGRAYQDTRVDSALYFLNLAQSLAVSQGKMLSAAAALDGIGRCLLKLNAYGQSMHAFNEGMTDAQDPKKEMEAWQLWPDIPLDRMHRKIMAGLYAGRGHLQGAMDNLEQQRQDYIEASNIARAEGFGDIITDLNIHQAKYQLHQDEPDSAINLIRQTLNGVQPGSTVPLPDMLTILAQAYQMKGSADSSIFYLHAARNAALDRMDELEILMSSITLSEFHIQRKQRDSSLYYARLAYDEVAYLNQSDELGTIYENLSAAYALNNKLDSAYVFQEMALRASENLFTSKINILSGYQDVNLSEQIRIMELEKTKDKIESRTRTYLLLAGTTMILLLAGIFYRNSKQQKKANKKILKAYSDLKETQAQLVQREKMASLGELTAGIAHEIQNPLNFVNNFSEINLEMFHELQDILGKDAGKETSQLLHDIQQNQQRIREHGKRAELIVRSMLAHSRNSSGVKEPTDIRLLVDEYVKLAYHGMKAKYKDSKAECKFQLSNVAGLVNIVPQEIGRVILNLVSNALYAVNDKARTAGPDYNPEVFVSLVRNPKNIEIKVKDNGNGMPPSVQEKIFQPFFTTKPPGEGTGLGLSLSYDIVTKIHGGELQVSSTEGRGSAFTVILPVS